MKTVREILKAKGDKVYSISPNATVFEALTLMAEKEIGALLVYENGLLFGIMSERDYARKVTLEGKSSKELTVQEIMSSKVIYVTSKHSTDECMALMSTKRIRHIPVIDDEKLAGIISIGDVVKAVIEEKDFVIDQLVHYITDTPAISKADTWNKYKEYILAK
jgi:CBS domain-containing protein